MSDHPVDSLDQFEFDDKASMAASMLAGHGHAFVDLQPGDGTTYKIVVVQPLIAAHSNRSATGWTIYPNAYWVGTSFGPLYPTPLKGGYDWGYVLEHFVYGNGGTAEWTARVIARFLNALSEKFKEER